MAKEKKVGIIAEIPFDSGWLSGKYNEEIILMILEIAGQDRIFKQEPL